MKTNQIKRGRPALVCNPPAGLNRFTINDLRDANPHIKCRLSLYTKRDELVKNKVIRLTKDTVPTAGGVGKPLGVYITVAALNRSRAAKKAARTRKALAAAPAIDLTVAASSPDLVIA
jgi:hypothetical protein